MCSPTAARSWCGPCARRFETIEGLVLSENKDMLDFVAALGFAIHRVPETPATVRVVRKL